MSGFSESKKLKKVFFMDIYYFPPLTSMYSNRYVSNIFIPTFLITNYIEAITTST